MKSSNNSFSSCKLTTSILKGGVVHTRGFRTIINHAFSIMKGPTKSEKWIKDHKRSFEICGCIEDQKEQYTSYLLQEEASVWWNTKRKLIIIYLGSLGAISLHRFEKKCEDCLFLAILRQWKAREFTSLIKVAWLLSSMPLNSWG